MMKKPTPALVLKGEGYWEGIFHAGVDNIGASHWKWLMDTVPDKTFFRIGEVSRILGVPPYVIRYWESEFKTVKPSRTRSDQRLYRRQDVQNLLVIKRLLYEEKFTIDGARRHLRSSKRADAFSGDLPRGAIIEEIKEGLLWIREKVG